MVIQLITVLVGIATITIKVTTVITMAITILLEDVTTTATIIHMVLHTLITRIKDTIATVANLVIRSPKLSLMNMVNIKKLEALCAMTATVKVTLYQVVGTTYDK